jgi:hypothetical protein
VVEYQVGTPETISSEGTTYGISRSTPSDLHAAVSVALPTPTVFKKSRRFIPSDMRIP